MLTELGGKGGCLCEPARRGELRCPLMVRPNSEDVVTGNIFGTLRLLNPRWWLPDFLNQALNAERFRRQVYRNLRIKLWQKQAIYPRQFLPWAEGNTEVDVVITWENPPTTIFIEMKYISGLGPTTVNNDGTGGYPSDQLIRNARVGLRHTGWFHEDYLFPIAPRDFVLVLCAPVTGNPLVQRYRNPQTLKSSIPHGDTLKNLPRLPFVGELDFRRLVELLQNNERWFTQVERRLIGLLDDYIRLKLHQLPTFSPYRQG